MRTTASLPGTARSRVVTGLLLFAAGTMILTGIYLVFPGFATSGVPQGAELLTMLALIAYGSWLGLTRAGFVAHRRLAAWSAIAVPLLVWLLVVWSLAPVGAFQSRLGPAPAIVLPLLIGLPILLGSRTIGPILDATPPAWLIGAQVFRILGSAFLAGWLAGNLPGVFALPAGTGDTLVGVLALPVALLLESGARGARVLAIAWNVLGILDLIDAVALAALSHLALAYPLVLIPAFAVPFALLLHVVSLRQLRRLDHHQARPLSVEPGSGRSGRADGSAEPQATAREPVETQA